MEILQNDTKTRWLEKEEEEYNTILVDTQTAVKLWGTSYSSFNKLVQDPDPKDESSTRTERINAVEQELLKNNVIPKFLKFGKGQRRKWKLQDIADWLFDTELKT